MARRGAIGRIAVVGAGPAGLLLAYLLRSRRTHLDVLVFERQQGVDGGWGVVLSEATRDALRGLAPEVSDALEPDLLPWDLLRVVRDDESAVTTGHRYAGLERRALLGRLRERCEGAGVKLAYGTRVREPGDLADADLVVGADGIDSVVRSWDPARFGSRTRTHAPHFVWLATDRVFPCMTLIFRSTAHGLVQAHAYPFSERLSTFIVQCEEATWRAGGLADASPGERLRFCEDVFARDLRGAALLSDGAGWRRFRSLRTAHLGHGRRALVGDAAHTCHFSIGSGTKVALEDAGALASALLDSADLPEALRTYELDRLPRVTRMQSAARRSAAYFDGVSRYARQSSRQFFLNAATRSGRVTFASLDLADPEFARRPAGHGRDAPRDVAQAGAAPWSRPLDLGAMRVANRVAAAPAPTPARRDAGPTPASIAGVRELARAGVGLVLGPQLAVSATGRATSRCHGLYTPEHRDAWAEAVCSMRGESAARIVALLDHAGPRASTRPRDTGLDRALERGGWQPIAPDARRYGPTSAEPAPAGVRDLDEVVRDFAAAAGFAADAGFDALVLDMAHGNLLSAFLSPLTNGRDDELGGDEARRARLPVVVLSEVRSVWPPGKPLGVRLNVHDGAPGGVVPDEAVRIAARLRAAGCDFLVAETGQVTADAWLCSDRDDLIVFADVVRNASGLPVVLGGQSELLDEVDTVIAAGRADLCKIDCNRIFALPRAAA